MALESVETQRCGLVFIYDMSDSKYANFDYDLSQKILTLLKVCLSIYFSFLSRNLLSVERNLVAYLLLKILSNLIIYFAQVSKKES